MKYQLIFYGLTDSLALMTFIIIINIIITIIIINYFTESFNEP